MYNVECAIFPPHMVFEINKRLILPKRETTAFDLSKDRLAFARQLRRRFEGRLQSVVINDLKEVTLVVKSWLRSKREENFFVVGEKRQSNW